MGDDYPTPDGTCIRDYIHVSDLASAHVLAVERLCRGGDGEGLSLNLGTGTGISVQAILTAAEQVAGRHLDCAVGSRRPGDPPMLVADGSRARDLLGWSAALFRGDHPCRRLELAHFWESYRPKSTRLSLERVWKLQL